MSDEKLPKGRTKPPGEWELKNLREFRIQKIYDIMKTVCNKDGTLAWNRTVRKVLGAQWNLTDVEVMKLSAEAHKRIKKDITDAEEVHRNTGTALQIALGKTLANEKWSDLAKIATVSLKLTEGPRTEIIIKEKLPTVADATQAVKELFGPKVSNAPDSPADEPQAEPTDSPAEEGGASEE